MSNEVGKWVVWFTAKNVDTWNGPTLVRQKGSLAHWFFRMTVNI